VTVLLPAVNAMISRSPDPENEIWMSPECAKVFPTSAPVRRLFPEQTDHYAVVNTADLAEAVRRVSLVLDRLVARRERDDLAIAGSGERDLDVAGVCEGLPHLGVQLEVAGTELSLVATDRYRVALRDVAWDGGTVAGEAGVTSSREAANATCEMAVANSSAGTSPDSPETSGNRPLSRRAPRRRLGRRHRRG
jgi:hypothetical protein